MCGRYSQATPVEQLADLFSLAGAPQLKPRYNIAPSQQVAVIRLSPGDGWGRLDLMHWGLIPAWEKDLTKARQPINAKSETVAELPTFRVAFRQRRCLIPTDGFYEWQQEGGRKQPVYICMKDRESFAFAGLWERWERPDQEPIDYGCLATRNDLSQIRWGNRALGVSASGSYRSVGVLSARDTKKLEERRNSN